jgi:branched-chain amino acid transport system substrate-binding protein
MALVIVTSFSLVTGKSYASQSAAPTTVVRLCSSAPIGIPPSAHLVQGIFNGVIMATNQWKAKFRKAGLTLLAPLTMNDARSDGSQVDAAKERQNAHACLDRSDTFGYIGTLNSSMAQVSEPILNQGGMVMISPSNSNPVLTDPSQRQTYEPATYNHTL